MEQPPAYNPFGAPQSPYSQPTGPQPSSGGPANFGVLKAGLIVLFIGVLLITIALFGIIGLQGLVWISKGRVGDIVPLIAAVSMFLLVIGALVYFVGAGLCLATPSQTRARGLAIATFVLLVASVLLVVGAAVMGASLGLDGAFGRRPSRSAGQMAGIMLMVGMLASLASHVCMLLFCRKLAAFLNRRDLAGRAVGILVASVILLVIRFGLNFYMMSIRRRPSRATIQGLMCFMLLLNLVVAIVFSVFAGLLDALRKHFASIMRRNYPSAY